ncbi:MAG TPA: ABC transporter substrate-binding protein [Spirochaetia bacterium]|nr:ABC transporter substrate-binding protein [Spirochaetales bacterium]HRY79017.1 ABC transporter substrate-binding protein [Spirochaetia bacterium]
MNLSRSRSVPVAALVLIVAASAHSQVPPARIIMGGRAAVLVADAVYAFPSARSRVITVGGGDQGLGTFLQELDPSYPSKPVLDRNAAAEVYAAYRPDLAIFKSALKRGVGGALESLGIRVHYLDLETPEDYYRDLEGLGRILGEPSRAAELVAYYKGVVETAARISAGASRKPRVLVVQAVGDAWEVPPASWMQTRIVEMAGGVPVWIGANPGEGWARVGLEQVAAWNPDVLLVIDYRRGVDEAVARMRADPRFSLLAAGKSGMIRGFPQDFFSWDQPDTRWALGLLWTVKTLHPDRSGTLSLEAEARRFYRVLYGFDDAAFDRAVRPRLTGDHGIR